MADDPEKDREPDAAERVLAELAERTDAGEPVDLDEACAAHPALAGELRALWSRWRRLDAVFSRLASFPPGEPRPEPEGYVRGLLAELAERRGPRYEPGDLVGRGGVADVHRAWDRELRREVAMKRLRPPAPGAPPSAHDLSRFVEEAHVAARIDHPGVAPVFDLGVDADGRVYFTMPLVRGASLEERLARVRRGDPEWTTPRALAVLLRVCETMAHAHARGVVHRDLKPANVLVGELGETYVVDWGLARVAGRPDEPAPRRTHRGEVADGDPGSPLLTADGDVVGTALYMAPEQAAGDVERVGPPADVWAVGAMLYELLAGRRPYLAPDELPDRAEVLERIRTGPPAPLPRGRRGAPAELAAVCEKAMAREPEDRYATMEALAADLRAYLEGRVVSAHRTGALAELSKWTRRNPLSAGALALVLALVVGGLALLRAQDAARHRAVVRLADAAVLAGLEAEADGLWPAAPARVPAYDAWLGRAEALSARVADHAEALAALRARARPRTAAERERDRATHPAQAEIARLASQVAVLEAGWPELAEEADVPGDHSGTVPERLARLRARIAELEARAAERRTFTFADPTDQSRHDTIARLVAEHARFVDPDPLRGPVASVRALRTLALELARALERDAGRWAAARTAVAADPRFAGLDLGPQLGLVPLGPDPASGLQEFAHLASGAVPERGPDGRLALGPEHGLVLVLVPGGPSTMGALPRAPDAPPAPYRDPHALANERPLVELELEPFLVGKHELTQAQWERLTGANPSRAHARVLADLGADRPGVHPVESVDWDECMTALSRVGLELPTEAQWEHAARAGTTTPRWCGEGVETLYDRENLRDLAGIVVERGAAVPDPAAHDDGWKGHAPVDAFAPNPWGLVHVLGNVSEWTRDTFMVDARWPRRPGDGLRLPPEDHRWRVARGASYWHSFETGRSARRQEHERYYKHALLGLRVARDLER